ncbi:hypothetical protein IEQ34_006854 [Dendrobium chrysotoxum]|uniref:Ubiquitin-like protease family profile domain-containing protein n=1 Tax=Dendrobium chrysotoxum TaxID=161865 RepID=A0AAV7H7Z5_DENCH|nr:hypothetical protein IEQ34_006854 [Dendrobium chrysotoxum]
MEYLGDNYVDAFALLLSEKSRIMIDIFQPFLYISHCTRLTADLLQVYNDYKQPFYIYVQHINPISVNESNLTVQPIICSKHWTVIIGRLKERIWKLYDSLPNPEHKNICYEVIKFIYEETEGAFTSNRIKWNLQTVYEISTQTNNVDCRIFVCKYMEKAILRRKVDWASYKD